MSEVKPKSTMISKSFWLNAAVLLLALIAAATQVEWVAANAQLVSYLTAATAALNLVIRFFTVGPIYIPGFGPVDRGDK